MVIVNDIATIQSIESTTEKWNYMYELSNWSCQGWGGKKLSVANGRHQIFGKGCLFLRNKY
jgi:hypothetical protein